LHLLNAQERLHGKTHPDGRSRELGCVHALEEEGSSTTREETMRKRRRARHLLAVAVAVLAADLTTGVASGAPVNAPNTATITVTCPSGTIEGVVILVRGEFTPAFAVGSNTVFIPIAFGEFTGAAVDAEGNVLFTVDEPPLAKGSAVPQNGKLVECTGVIELDVPGGHFSGSSSISGFIPNP
jgi:hypothetical protein